MDVDEDAGVAGLVGAGERDGGRAGTATTGDGDLIAGHIELSAVGTTSGMQCDDLGTKEVVAGGDIRRDLDIHLAAARVQVLGTPEVVVARATRGVLCPAVLEDLEPTS